MSFLINPYVHAAGGGGGGSGYDWYRTITIDHTKLGGSNLTNYRVFVSGTYTYLKTVGNGGKVENANGYDVAFFADSALTTQLKHETKRYVASTGEVIYWVKVPTVSASVDTVIYMAYANTSISTDQSDAAGTWNVSDEIVHHYEDGSSLSLADSTANARNGTGVNTPTAATGQAGGGVGLSGSNQYVQTSYSTTLTDLTVSFWMKANSNSGTVGIWSWAGVSQDTSPTILIQNNAGQLRFYVEGNYRESSASITTGTWYHIAITLAGSATWKFYRNGSELSTYTGSSAATDDTVYTGSGFDGQLNGVMDEMRFASAARSASWITAEYNNMVDPSSFYAVGAETAA